ncbi:MAG TPA: xanthine dehydrogenase family protein molybdopterin-binding subunit, partial [Candidatus Saccharimonadales bacterium]|nr:xanthine dehydrogenase family protein molybdopterin-binding subunit [Candidatus Saccharimonadales bacterium]
MNAIIGQPLNRVDGKLKVTGKARYSAEYPLANLAHAVSVEANIAKGQIKTIETSRAESAPGVIAVLTHRNAPKLHAIDSKKSQAMPGEFWPPLQDDTVFYDGQVIALVVADSFEQAQYAATLVTPEYQKEGMQSEATTSQPKKNDVGQKLRTARGDVEKGLAEASVRLQETYRTPVEHHNPMEPHATIALWNEDELILYDSTQGVMATRTGVAESFGIPKKKVHVISLFLGGGFGCKGALWARPLLAAMAAKQVARPVKFVVSRRQMFTANGHRPQTTQEINLGAAQNGALTAIRHVTTVEGSTVSNFIEPSGAATQMLYACPNLEVLHTLMRLDHPGPTFMRAPGEATGTYALEAALDELAYRLKMDPVQLRLVNYTDTDPEGKKPFSSKHLKECYQVGSQLIGWTERNPKPGSMREGGSLIGYGMATATYPAHRWPASARAQILANGRAVVESATQDLGTGTYTIMTQIAAESLDLPVERIEFKLGDSLFPEAPVSGGSASAASVGPAVRAASLAVKKKLVKLALGDSDSPLHGQSEDSIAVENGRLFLRQDVSKGETYAEILGRQKLPDIEAESTELPDDKHHSFHSFGAQFVKVKVDPLLGTVRVTKCASVMDIGRVLNAKTARSQVIGGVVFGIGMALFEHTVF